MKVSELMNPEVVTVGAETSLKQVAEVLTERRISGVPVVDSDGRLLGVVSEADIVLGEQGPLRARGRLLGWIVDGGLADDDRLAAQSAGEAMTTPAVTITTGADVSFEARRMIDAGVKRLPVVDSDGRVVGIVTRSDLVRAFARSDEELEREIRGLVKSDLWLDQPGLVEVQVDEGEAVLAGTVDRRSDAELLRLFVARIPGIVGVRSTVEWLWDDRKAPV